MVSHADDENLNEEEDLEEDETAVPFEDDEESGEEDNF